MSHVLVVYESKYGQTRKIAERVLELAQRRGHDARLLHVTATRADDVKRADLVVVLAPVFGGKHPKTIRRFLEASLPILAQRTSAFYSVSGSAASARVKERDAAQDIAKKLVDGTGWSPKVVASIGGAIDFPKYNPILRFVMKLIARRNGGSTDTSRAHELTNWATVESITANLLAELEDARPPITQGLPASPAA